MAVSEETLPSNRSLRVPRRVALLVAFAVAAVLGAAGVTVAATTFHDSLAGRILPGVSIDGVDVGGLTPDAARGVLAIRYEPLASGGVLVRSPLGSTTIGFADVGRGADVDAMVAEAVSVGRGGTWLDETIAAIRTRLEPRSVALRLTYDPSKAASRIHEFAAQMDVEPVDASAVRTATGFGTVPSSDGHRLDEAAAVAAVNGAMVDRATAAGDVVDAVVTTTRPRLMTIDADRVRATAEAMAGTKLTLASGKKTWTISGGRIRTWIGFAWVNGVYRPVVDRTLIPASLKTVAKRVARPVHDAAFLRDKHGRIVGAMADSAGRELDLEAAVNRIADALDARAGGPGPTKIAVPLAAVLPKTTAAQVARTAPLMEKVGSWTTFYQVAAHNGFGANITVPTRTLNGTVVQPGEVFDFWRALGEVSFRTGYRLGGAIVGGHSVEGKALAGGICAASTTLFNAALRGGFEIDARQPHWYYITRYPLGLDATVSGSQTMRFRNDTAYPILIRGFASPGIVRYEIWSVPNGRRVTLTRPIVTNVVKGYDSTVQTTTLPAGTNLRTEWPVDGKDVSVTRIVRDASGRVIHQETYISHYHRMVGINMIGVA